MSGTPEGQTREELEALQKKHAQTYWAIVRTQFKKNVPGMIGFWFIVFIVITSILAPLIANDRPIVARYKGELVFPAVASYVKTWVPWGSMRNSMESWGVGGDVVPLGPDGNPDPVAAANAERPYYPFSPHYESLQGLSWKQADAAGAPDMAWSLWPPVRWSPTKFDTGAIKQRPSGEHLLGTDDQGRDVFSRVIHGCVVAVMVGVVAMGMATVIGVVLGLTAGFFRGKTDMILSRIVEVVMVFPTFFLIIAVISFLEKSIMNIMLVIGLFRWTGIYRLVRGEVLKSGSQDYVVAAHALGIPRRSIMFKHILPNSVAPVFVSVAFGIAGAVLTETSLSFLGFGDITMPSWGEIVNQGRTYISEGLDYLVIWPGFAIFVTLTAFNLFGQGLRDAMDPRLRR